MLLRQDLDLATVDVDLRHQPNTPLFGRLPVEGIGGLQLCATRLDSGRCCDNLQVRATDGQHCQVARVFYRELVGAYTLLNGTIVVECGEVDDRLSQSRTKINVIEWPDNRGKRETGDRDIQPQARCPKVDLLHCFGHRARNVRKQGAASNSVLAAGLPQHFVETNWAQIVSKAAVDGFAER